MENVVDDSVGDSQTPVSLIPKAEPHRHGTSRVLYVLLGLTLLGVIIEGRFIFHLYHRTHKTLYTQMGSCDCNDSNEFTAVLYKRTEDSRPVAFLQGIGTEKHQDGVVRFQHETILKGLQYKEGKLHIQQEGYYYIYSKIYFSETCALFKHQVMWNSPQYSSPINFMQSLRYFCLESDEDKMRDNADVGNSFLGGVFQLHEGDTVYVYVNDTTLIRPGTNDNFFGVFMI